MQVMVQVVAPTGAANELNAWCLRVLGPQLLAQGHAIDRLVVNLGQPAPAEGPYGAGESLEGDPIDAILQAWLAPQGDAGPVVDAFEDALGSRAARWHGYRLTDHEVLNRFGPRKPGMTPGIKLMRGLYLHDDLPDPAAKRLWAHHSGLASRVHLGMARYARHWVEEVLTPQSPAIRGLSDLHFPDEASMRERYFDSPRGRAAIMHDIGHFICGGTRRFYGQEYILR